MCARLRVSNVSVSCISAYPNPARLFIYACTSQTHQTTHYTITNTVLIIPSYSPCHPCIRHVYQYGQHKISPTIHPQSNPQRRRRRQRRPDPNIPGRTDVTSIPVEKFVAVAGQNVTLPCPGVYEHSLVNALTWKTASATVAQYANGIPLVYNTRVKHFICNLVNLAIRAITRIDDDNAGRCALDFMLFHV